MVVEGADDTRLAIECDGDEFHGSNRWPADMQRQRILERAGWVFWRCFASTWSLRKDDVLAFRLNTDDLVIAGPDHPLRVAGTADNPALYLHVRRGCEARLNRSTWAQLAEIALAEGADAKGWRITSRGMDFACRCDCSALLVRAVRDFDSCTA